jgi:hypothetical protein
MSDDAVVPALGFTHTDEVVGYAERNAAGVEPPVMIRRWYRAGQFIGARVFVGGWRVGSYKTERGAERRARRESAREAS